MAIALSRDTLWPPEIDYPESDGRPMAETDVHARCIIDVRFMLETHFAADPDVYVSGNILLYYEQGDPRQSLAPDVLVARGVPKGMRRIYRLWQEGVTPQFVLEVTSRSTRVEDLGAKRGIFETLGVAEYVLFDPLEEYLRPASQMYRLVGDRYEALAPNASGALVSDVLGLEFHRRGDQLRAYDPVRGEWLRSPAEAEAGRELAETGREQAEAGREQAEAGREQAEVRRELAEAARRAAEAGRRVAEARASAAVAEIMRLRAELEKRS